MCSFSDNKLNPAI